MEKIDKLEKIKLVVLCFFIFAIICGSGVLLWQITKQNKQSQDTIVSESTKRTQEEVSELNKQINELKKSLEEAKAQGGSSSSTSGGRVAGVSTSSDSKNVGGKINLNNANINQLDSLPGIGSAYAQRIIDYRGANGGFRSIEEIKNIKGIGEKTFEKLKDLITI